MLRALTFLALIAACGGKKDPAPTTPTSSSATETTAAADEQPLPPVTKVGDACRASKDCAPLGSHHKCMRSGSTAACYPSPMKTCDTDCSCFNNDPCAANELGTCTGYESGMVTCAK